MEHAKTVPRSRDGRWSWLRRPHPWFAATLSILALAVAGWSGYEGRKARLDSRALGRLDLRPDVRLSTSFKPIKSTPTYYGVRNVGPVDAVQLEVVQTSMRYYSEHAKIRFYGSGSENRTYVGSLAPGERKAFAFSDHWLNVNARLHEPLPHNVLEIRLIYRRESDLTEYSARAFYFINPTGEWVAENDGSLTPDTYGAVIDAAHHSKAVTMPAALEDPLHEIGDGDELPPMGN